MGFLGGGFGNVLKKVGKFGLKGAGRAIGISLPFENKKLFKREDAAKQIAKKILLKGSNTSKKPKLSTVKSMVANNDELAKSISNLLDLFDDGELNQSVDEEKIEQITRSAVCLIITVGVVGYGVYAVINGDFSLLLNLLG